MNTYIYVSKLTVGFFQTVYTRKINPNARILFVTRLVLSVISTGAIFGALGPVYSAVTVFDGKGNLLVSAYTYNKKICIQKSYGYARRGFPQYLKMTCRNT